MSLRAVLLWNCYKTLITLIKQNKNNKKKNFLVTYTSINLRFHKYLGFNNTLHWQSGSKIKVIIVLESNNNTAKYKSFSNGPLWCRSTVKSINVFHLVQTYKPKYTTSIIIMCDLGTEVIHLSRFIINLPSKNFKVTKTCFHYANICQIA